MPAHSTHLYIGFGGSGSKTLAAFAEVVAAHHEMGGKSETNFAFILVDTFDGDLDKGRRRIERAFEKCGSSPILKMFPLAKDFPTFNPRAGQILSDAMLADTSGRLGDFWWTKEENGEKVPFTAVRFPHRPADGAGQAPLISTFLAWHWMGQSEDDLRSLVRDVVNELKTRAAAQGITQDLGLTTTVIAGLAGGTGRGCWHILSTLVSQVLREEGQTNQPIGFFFDASTLPEILALNPLCKMKMTINSLTGFSELVGFRRNEIRDVTEVHHHRLPSLTNPSDTNADILDTVNLVGRDLNGKPLRAPGHAPVSRAFVLFQSGRAGAAGESTLYYKVAANALYARFVEAIRGAGANVPEIGGLGCASFAVPIADVKDYARQMARRAVPRRLTRTADAADITAVVDRFMQSLLPGTFSSPQERDAAELFGRLSARVVAAHQNRCNEVEKLAKAGSHDKLRAQLEQIGRLPNSPDGKRDLTNLVFQEIRRSLWGQQPAAGEPGVGGVLRELGVLAALDGEDFQRLHPADAGGKPSGVIEMAVRRLVNADRVTLSSEATPSVDLVGYGTKKAIVDAIAARLQQHGGIVGKLPVKNEERADVAVKPLEDAIKGIFNWTISSDEVKNIKRSTEAFLLEQSHDTLRDSVAEAFSGAATSLKSLSERLGTVIAVIEQKSDAEKMGREQLARDSFWGEDDFDLILKSKVGDVRYDGSILAETEIKPVLADADRAIEEEVHRTIENSGEGLWTALTEFRTNVAGWLDAGTDSQAGGGDRQRLDSMVSKAFRAMAAKVELGSGFYRDNFSLRAVVGQHLRAWSGIWASLKGAPETREKLEKAFKLLFGAKMPAEMQEADFATGANQEALAPVVRGVCMEMARNLGHRCDVLVTQRAQSRQAIDRATVVLPSEAMFNTQFADECRQAGVESGLFRNPAAFTVVTTYDGQSSDKGNAFAMFGYAQEDFDLGQIGDDAPLEGISSLTRQYLGDPEVLAWLVACEDPEGTSVFEDDSNKLAHAEKCFGLGYSFPFLVRNDRMRKSRWRPWAREVDKQLQAREESRRDAELFAVDALLFSLLDESPNDDTGVTKANAAMQPVWDMPLMVMPPAGSDFDALWAFKRQAFRVNQGKVSATAPAFNAGDSHPGILALLESLGQRTNGVVDALAAEAAMYFGKMLPSLSSRLTPDNVVRRLFEHLEDRLLAVQKDLEGPADMTKRAKEKLEVLVERCRRLKDFSCVQLADHFSRQRGS